MYLHTCHKHPPSKLPPQSYHINIYMFTSVVDVSSNTSCYVCPMNSLLFMSGDWPLCLFNGLPV